MKKILIYISIFLFIFILSTNTLLAFSPSSKKLYNGIDVSEWQGDINYSQVADDDIKIVYIKASEGNNYVDPYFKDNYTNAKANGLKVGFYHFLTAQNTSDAISEANFFVSVIKDLSSDCRLAMDFEVFDGLSKTEINDISKVFLEEVKRLTNKDVVIYSNAYNAANTFSKELASEYPIWVANYFVSEPENGNWNTWIGFQYSNQRLISGINGYVDKDYFTDEILLSDNSNIKSDTASTIPQNTNYIVVQYGNTLSEIAAKFNTSYTYLAKINNISNPNLIYAGEKIYVPTLNGSNMHDTNHTLYIVQHGNTLTYISNLYNVSIESIVELNHIQNANLIYTGEILRIP